MFKELTLTLQTLSVLIACCCILPAITMAVETGVKAPQFNVESGDEKSISLSQLQDRVIIILYESKDAVEQNRSFKHELSVLLNSSEALKSRAIVLPVIDCSSASWMTKGVWKSNLIKNSSKEKVIIYGDWEGNMLKDYAMEKGKSNIVVIDRSGIVRYFKSGKIDDNETIQCKDLIKKLGD